MSAFRGCPAALLSAHLKQQPISDANTADPGDAAVIGIVPGIRPQPRGSYNYNVKLIHNLLNNNIYIIYFLLFLLGYVFFVNKACFCLNTNQKDR